jgi:hypothetical protein
MYAHLHFQLMDRASPLRGEGMPYALSAFVGTQRVAGDFPIKNHNMRLRAISCALSTEGTK